MDHVATPPIWPIVTGTGHRDPHPRPEVEAWLRPQLRAVLRRLRDQHGTTTVISGLALRWDTWLADEALDLGLELWAYCPGRWQADNWSPGERAHWEHLRSAATRVEHAHLGDRYPGPWPLHTRNGMMFRDADLGLTDWRPDRFKGGTYGGVNCAYDRGCPMIWFNPRLDVPGCEGRCCQPRMPSLGRWAELLKRPERIRRRRPREGFEQPALLP